MTKVTLDTNCFNVYEDKRLDPIFQLEEEGRICVFYADAALFEVLSGKLKISDLPERKRAMAEKRLNKIQKFNQIKSWQTFSNHYNTFPMRFVDRRLKDEIADILFPDRHNGGKYQEGDVRHLYAHRAEKNDVFITSNTVDFIENGKREKLLAMGITVMTPEEFIAKFQKT